MKVAILAAVAGLAMFAACRGDSTGADGGLEPAPMTVMLDTAAAAGSTIDSAGGVITATGADSTRYTLTVPPAALPDSRSVAVTVTPVSTLVGLPASGGNVTAVHFEPDGLSFGVPATLRLELPQAYDEQDLLAYTYEGDGARVAFVPIEDYDPNTATVTILIHHFSGAGVALGDRADVSANPTNPATAQHYRQRIALIEKEALEQGQYAYYEPQYLGRISQVYIDWFGGLLADSIRDVSSLTLQPTRELAERYSVWLAALLDTQCKIQGGCVAGAVVPNCFAESGLSPQLDDIRQYSAERFTAQYQSGLEAARSQCLSEAATCDKVPLITEGLAWRELAQFGGITFDPCLGVLGYVDITLDLCGEAVIIGDVIFADDQHGQLVEGQQAIEGLSVFDMMGEALDATASWSELGLSVAWSVDNESVLLLEDSPCVSTVPSTKVTALAPGVARLTATVTGQGVCDSDPMTAVMEFVVLPDTAPPSVTGGGVDTGRLIVGGTDGMSGNLGNGCGFLSEGSGLDYAEFYIGGELFAVAACSLDADPHPLHPPRAMCTYGGQFTEDCTHPISLGAIVVDRVGNRSEYTPIGSVCPP